ncbi:MAG: DMT family transporter [Anaerolineales bacterium]|nr:DMT family transporter [Anaerolineales bacterium]
MLTSTPYFGEIVSLITSLCFAVGPTFFTLAGAKAGSDVVNRARLLAAFSLLMIIHLVVFGSFIPMGTDGYRWGWLLLSGAIGLGLGDLGLFRAFNLLGTRLAMLFLSTSPVISLLLAWIFLGETLTIGQGVGILMVVGGVAWVIYESNQTKEDERSAKDFRFGILMATLGAFGQAVGLLTAKLGASGGYPAISGQLIRMMGGVIIMWGFTIIIRKTRYTVEQLRHNSSAINWILWGTLVGPILGLWVSLLGVQYTPSLGISSTLQSLAPVFLLPISYFVFNERYSWKVVIATLLALAGIAVLFFI